MLVSGREAVRILLTDGKMTGAAQARSLLGAGAAGPGVITGPGVLFDRDAVRALAGRPWLDEPAQLDACPHGAYISRLPRSTCVDLTKTWIELVVQVDRAPPMPALTVALLGASVTVAGRLPWIATLHGFVVIGADLTGLDSERDAPTRFRLEPPGDWFDAWRNRRVAGTRGGRPWVIRRPRGS